VIALRDEKVFSSRSDQGTFPHSDSVSRPGASAYALALIEQGATCGLLGGIFGLRPSHFVGSRSLGTHAERPSYTSLARSGDPPCLAVEIVAGLK
jgi:hypothetical protein